MAYKMKRYVTEFANDCIFHLQGMPKAEEATENINKIVVICSLNRITELEAVQAIINAFVNAFDEE